MIQNSTREWFNYLWIQESSEWKVKYEMMKQQAEKSSGVQEKYAALEAQYQALAAIVSASEGTEAIAKVSNLINCFLIRCWISIQNFCTIVLKNVSMLESFINFTARYMYMYMYIRFIITGQVLFVLTVQNESINIIMMICS